MNIAEENAQARANTTVTDAQLKMLARQRETAKLVGATTDVYSNPPDSYKIALSKITPEEPTVGSTYSSPPDGYAIALKQRREGR